MDDDGRRRRDPLYNSLLTAAVRRKKKGRKRLMIGLRWGRRERGRKEERSRQNEEVNR